MALEIVIEFPMSLGLAYHVAHHHRGHEVLQVLDAAERAGITAALQRLQHDGGYCLDPSGHGYQRGHLQTQVTRHTTSEDTLRPPHAHVLIASHTPDGAQVHLPAVARAATSAQHAAVAALAHALIDDGIGVETARTPAGRELVAFAQHARQLPRVMNCPPVQPGVQQVRPLDRYDTTASTA
jgi:hypothetical protein